MKLSVSVNMLKHWVSVIQQRNTNGYSLWIWNVNVVSVIPERRTRKFLFYIWSNRYSLRKVHMKYSSKLLQRPANPMDLVHLQKNIMLDCSFCNRPASPDDPDNLQNNFILDCPLWIICKICRTGPSSLYQATEPVDLDNLQKLPNWTALFVSGRSIQMIQIIIKFTLSLRCAKVSLQQTLLTMLGWNPWRSCIFKPRKWLRLKSHHSSSTFP